MYSRIYKHFLLICFLLGLSPYFTVKPAKTNQYNFIFRFIPCCLSITISTVFFMYSFAMKRTIFLSYGKINDFIGSGYLLILIVAVLSGNYQCFRYQTEYCDLMKRIFRRRNLPCFGSYKVYQIQKTFLLKSVLIFAVYLSAVLVLFINDTTLESIFFKIEIAALQFVSTLNTLHAMLYIEIVRSYLKVSGTFILNRAAQIHNELAIEERHFNLKRFKKIYFDWWNIMQKINVFFGWSLLTMLIKCFVEISFTFYYYFVRRLQADLDTSIIIQTSASLLLSIINITIPINSCHYCSSEVFNLMEILERYTFWTANTNLYQIKREIFHEMKRFPIQIQVKGFVTIDRRLLIVMVSGCCTYIIIFIQFHMATSPS